MVKTELSGMTAIVTGGSKGYGLGIAEGLKAKGVQVWITGRDDKALATTAKHLKVESIRADVTRAEDWDRLIASVMKATGKLDILVNNAGSGVHITQLADMTDEEVLESIAVNLTGAILGCRRAAKIMMRQESGTIINVSSVCQSEAWPGWSVYSAAKAGLAQLSNCLYTEMRPHGVRVTTLVPSGGATEFMKTAHLAPYTPEDKYIQPRELGDLVVTICELPKHLEMQNLTLWPMIQKVEPL